MQSTPRLRPDLRAVSVEESGIKYFDVSDPRSGSKMRMYDFEWLIAERMDGARRFDEVASWARERLGLAPSASDLSEYARRLEELGFFDAQTHAAEAHVESESDEDHRNDPDYTPLPRPSPMDSVEIDSEPLHRASRDDSQPSVEIGGDEEVTVADDAPRATPSWQQQGERTTGPIPIVQPAAADDYRPMGVPQPPPKKSSAGSLLAVLVLLLAVGGVVVYMQYFRQSPAKVAVMLASPREVVRLFDGDGKAQKNEPVTLSFGEGGKVLDAVAKGTEVEAGTPLATLEAYSVIEKSMADVKDRLSFYEKQLAAAQAKGSDSATKAAQAKVDEKRKVKNDLDAKAVKVRLLAPAGGVVSEVMVAAGGDAKAGAPAVKLGDNRLTVEFKIAAGAPKLGDVVSLQPTSGGPIAGKITAAPEGKVIVEISDETTIKTGDSLRLVKKKESNVVVVPLAAVQKRDAVDGVFVLSEGAAHFRKVTIVDRTEKEAYVASGLATGDSVIINPTAELKDGQKASSASN